MLYQRCNNKNKYKKKSGPKLMRRATASAEFHTQVVLVYIQ